jgi:hypothetical protein
MIRTTTRMISSQMYHGSPPSDDAGFGLGVAEALALGDGLGLGVYVGVGVGVGVGAGVRMAEVVDPDE